MVNKTELERLASLLRQRNDIDAQVGALIGRPLAAGHLGEVVAARVFGIDLEGSATAEGIDGRFARGPLFGSTVQIKCYGKHEGLLDITLGEVSADFYLVLTAHDLQRLPRAGRFAHGLSKRFSYFGLVSCSKH